MLLPPGFQYVVIFGIIKAHTSHFFCFPIFALLPPLGAVSLFFSLFFHATDTETDQFVMIINSPTLLMCHTHPLRCCCTGWPELLCHTFAFLQNCASFACSTHSLLTTAARCYCCCCYFRYTDAADDDESESVFAT